jgi:PiT family inorganic phosphate transporter
MTLFSFLSIAFSNPLLLAVIILIAGVIVVNGATDASNAIATVVSTRSLPPTASIMMAAVFNFFGLLVTTLLGAKVSDVIVKMIDFGTDYSAALWGIAAAAVAIIVWGAVAWAFGIPTSQSHSLIAALTGASIALQNGLQGIVWSEWVKVLEGLAAALLLGFSFGWLLAKLITLLFRGINRKKAMRGFGLAQIAAAAGLAFMHGAQDGQKFMAVLMMGIGFSLGHSMAGIDYPLWIILLCSLTMAVGTAVGGKKIIKSVAMDMVSLEKHEGFAASLAATACIFIATMTPFAMPLSTTHAKTAALMGVGAAKHRNRVRWSMAKDMLVTWVATFPGCGLIAYFLVKVFELFAY